MPPYHRPPMPGSVPPDGPPPSASADDVTLPRPPRGDDATIEVSGSDLQSDSAVLISSSNLLDGESHLPRTATSPGLFRVADPTEERAASMVGRLISGRYRINQLI